MVKPAAPSDAFDSQSPIRYLVLAASVLMLVFLGTNQAWSVFIAPLKAAFQYPDSRLQLVFTTAVFTFCFVIIPGGYLQDRFGPRPVALVSAGLMASGWFLASHYGDRFVCLWLGVGFLASAGTAMGYVCPVATAMKWFPRRAGLIAGLAAAGYGLGPILLSTVVEALLRRGWAVRDIFGFIGSVWPPVVLLMGLLLVLPPGFGTGSAQARFSRRALFRDRRFWILFGGMFFGTLPFLVVMGTVKPLGVAFEIGPAAAALAITSVACGNTIGRITWGHIVDHLGPRPSISASLLLMLGFMMLLTAGGRLHPAVFLAAVAGIGFCYGSNFAIYPSTVARLYGMRVLGSIYPYVMAAQGLASLAPTVSGLLNDVSGSYLPGLFMAMGLSVLGLVLFWVFDRSE